MFLLLFYEILLHEDSDIRFSFLLLLHCPHWRIVSPQHSEESDTKHRGLIQWFNSFIQNLSLLKVCILWVFGYNCWNHNMGSAWGTMYNSVFRHPHLTKQGGLSDSHMDKRGRKWRDSSNLAALLRKLSASCARKKISVLECAWTRTGGGHSIQWVRGGAVILRKTLGNYPLKDKTDYSIQGSLFLSSLSWTEWSYGRLKVKMSCCEVYPREFVSFSHRF